MARPGKADARARKTAVREPQPDGPAQIAPATLAQIVAKKPYTGAPPPRHSRHKRRARWFMGRVA
jgi:hypothetical protein